MTKEEIAGDDLNDGLDYQVDFSEDEGGVNITGDEAEQVEEPELKTEAKPSKKRKVTDSKLKEKKRIKMEFDLEQKKNISKESSADVIAEFINKTVSQKNKKLSSLELTDLFISKNDIRSTSDIDEERSLEKLPVFINNRFKNMLPSGKKNKKGTTETDERKYIAIISMSAIRACDVYRATKDLAGSSLKIINKNKIAGDLKVLSTSKSRILCCTPGRLRKVLENEEQVLKKDEVKIILLDNSYLDQKGQNIWDIPETIEVLKDLTKTGAKIYLY